MQIHVSRNYDHFQANEFNRAICQNHVNRLIDSPTFEKSFAYHPIIVNQDMTIIDGHHRYEAAKAKNIPVYYIVQPGAAEQEIMYCNTNQKQWDVHDYLNFHVKKNNPNYIFIKDLKEEHKISLHNLNVCICRIGSNANQMTYLPKFKNGELKITDKDNILVFLNETVPILKEIKHIEGTEKTRHFFSKNFINALVTIFLASKTEYFKILQLFKSRFTKVPSRYTTIEYVENLLSFVKGHKGKLTEKTKEKLKDLYDS